MPKNLTVDRMPIIWGDYATVALTRSMVAVIDARDVPLIGLRFWFAVPANGNVEKCYARTENRSGPLSMHNFILPSPSPDLFVDHISRDGLDNRRCNLRLATKSENNRNRETAVVSASGYRGVYPRKGKFRAAVSLDHRKRWLGTFETAEEAAIVRATWLVANGLHEFSPFDLELSA